MQPTAKQKIFDKTKPFGTISGHDESLPKGPKGELPKYEQNGMLFDHHGVYISGEYKPADVRDTVRDQADEIARLQRELAEAKAGDKGEQTLDRAAIVVQLDQLGVKWPKTGNTQTLYKLLQDTLDQQAA
jgi:hypothetical protein